MTEYDNIGNVSLWANVSDNTKAPKFKGKFFAHRDYKAGEEISISLWNNIRANPHGPNFNEKAPRFTGKVEDKFVPKDSGKPQAGPAPQDDFDDEIPF